MMKPHAPHFVLFSESRSDAVASCPTGTAGPRGDAARSWHFVLRSDDGSVALDVSDKEAEASEERLTLMAVVRGLEALPQPSSVTLVTRSGWIRRGLRFGLEQWRDNRWQWERYGGLAPVKNADLWQRVDRALRYHQVECRTIRIDPACDDLSGPVCRGAAHARRGDGPAPSRATDFGRPQAEGRSPVTADHLLLRVLRRLFGWCGLGGSPLTPVIASH